MFVFVMYVLVVNAGSSSLKYQLFDMDKHEVIAKGICERIGIDGKITHHAAGKARLYRRNPYAHPRAGDAGAH